VQKLNNFGALHSLPVINEPFVLFDWNQRAENLRPAASTG